MLKHKQHVIGILFIIGVTFISFMSVADAEEFHWGFKPSRDGATVEIGQPLEGLLEKYGAIYKGNGDQKVVYLTFDNGYENGFTESILNTLREEKAPATFFLTGHYLTSATDLVKTMIADGHSIGNHTDGHPNLTRLSASEMQKEWQQFDAKLKELTGIERTIYTRPPAGVFNEEVLKAGNEVGYRHMFWSIAFKDWIKDERRGYEYAYNALMNQLHPGAIILMHTVAQDNAEALPKFIQEAKKQGYTFGSLDDVVLEYEGVVGW
ncbi:polysaccharide deacetylase family protein [Solibacillus sp. FSL K6-1523]|uniref:polysaccharide deacetylase family protein n=1 Tax=Solibacillus sp. FSL K6-1523 TaxID=2921471 RepID=UPI0030F62097